MAELYTPVRTPEGVAYGGDQRWFPDPLRREDGCGAVAACDLLAFLAARGGAYAPLAPAGAGNIQIFLPWMDQLYDWLSPGFFGCWSRRRWTRRVLDWAADRGVPLRARGLWAGAPQAACEALIREGLERGSPVAALNLWKGVRRRYAYGWHWAVITDLRGDRLVLSTWGQRQEADWNEYYATAHRALCKGGFVYFE